MRFSSAIVPFVFYYPALVIELALRISPNVVNEFTARIFVKTAPLPHLIDPFVTLFFVKCYQISLAELFNGGRMFFKSSVHPSHGTPSVMPLRNVSTSMHQFSSLI